MTVSEKACRWIVAGALVVTLSACEEKGPAERAGEEVDEAAEEAGEALEEAGDEMEDAAH